MTLNKILAKPLFIPETKHVYDLFREFQFKKNQIAIVLDEFGGVIGLVSIEDILEELFGRMEEHKPQNALYRKQDENSWIIDASMTLEEFSTLTKVTLINEEFETVGGFVFDKFGKLPSVGDSIKYKGLTFTIKEKDVTRITEILVEKTK